MIREVIGWADQLVQGKHTIDMGWVTWVNKVPSDMLSVLCDEEICAFRKKFPFPHGFYDMKEGCKLPPHSYTQTLPASSAVRAIFPHKQAHDLLMCDIAKNFRKPVRTINIMVTGVSCALLKKSVTAPASDAPYTIVESVNLWKQFFEVSGAKGGITAKTAFSYHVFDQNAQSCLKASSLAPVRCAAACIFLAYTLAIIFF
jgi:hypothetical protein